MTLDGARPPVGATSCRATLAGKTVPLVGRSFAAGTAGCTWRVPRASRGKRLRLVVTAMSGGVSVVRSATRIVR
jgi:hypothetical protein